MGLIFELLWVICCLHDLVLFVFSIKVINNDFDGCEKIIEQASKGKAAYPIHVGVSLK